jgi:hypothetical protein
MTSGSCRGLWLFLAHASPLRLLRVPVPDGNMLTFAASSSAQRASNVFMPLPYDDAAVCIETFQQWLLRDGRNC